MDIKIGHKNTWDANGPKNAVDNQQAFAVKSDKVFKQTSKG